MWSPRLTFAGLGLGILILAGCAPLAPSADQELVRVPADAPTISEAMERVAPGGVVLVAPGTYTESVTIATDDVTLRGEDRNTVIIDGEGRRSQGVLVIADGVTVENLTVTSHTFNGVLVTGLHDGTNAQAHGVDGYEGLDTEKYPPLQRFAISHVTAYNNGLYGIYAFDAQHGTITDSYASGSADSGFYVGQCQECDIVVSGNTAENNAIGFENANASDSLSIVGNRWSGNRVGMTLISNYQEAFVPQRDNLVVGNLVSENVSSESPSQADGAFGIGIGIAGGQDNLLQRNRIEGNAYAGVAIANAEDIPASENQLIDNEFGSNGVDVADTSATRAPGIGTCIRGGVVASILPEALAASPCQSGLELVGADPGAMPDLDVPPGVSFLSIAAPPPQPSLAVSDAAPARLPDSVGEVDLDDYPLPGADFLARNSR
ncbi:nitrous oxide reductase family maturation protein NosD [Leifsonia sp. AK011]|uniref:right-handed parallel beta-helix repeat-containing protein n=1 Tax=Leifsonia sp. AK011 TaxID=2723075 RepID=UPI00211C4346|nr:right-handed parallel beta-helix repeat-containing protein [Leifsonia sp. AK011]